MKGAFRNRATVAFLCSCAVPHWSRDTQIVFNMHVDHWTTANRLAFQRIVSKFFSFHLKQNTYNTALAGPWNVEILRIRMGMLSILLRPGPQCQYWLTGHGTWGDIWGGGANTGGWEEGLCMGPESPPPLGTPNKPQMGRPEDGWGYAATNHTHLWFGPDTVSRFLPPGLLWIQHAQNEMGKQRTTKWSQRCAYPSVQMG